MAGFAPPSQQWVRGPVIGRGATATVSLGTCQLTGAAFAVKSVELRHSASLQREQLFLASIPPSPHVVPYLGFDVTAEGQGGAIVYNLFLELALGGSVADEVARCEKLEQSKVRGFTRHILLGLAHLHSNGIAHCDVKPRNVLVTADGATCKLADLGCAKRVVGEDAAADATVGGSPMYMAPEVARGEAQGTAADVWALGCTVLEMATGRPPWPDVKDPVSAMHRIGFSGDVPELPEELGADGREFLEKCFVRNPEGRWSAAELLAHPFTSSSYSSKGNRKDAFFAFPLADDDTNWPWRPSPKCVLDGDDLWGIRTSASTSSSTGDALQSKDEQMYEGRPAASTPSSTAHDRISQLADRSSCSTWTDATTSSSSWAWSWNHIADDNDVGGSEWITIRRSGHTGGSSLSQTVSESKTPSEAQPCSNVANHFTTTTARSSNHYSIFQPQSCKVQKIAMQLDCYCCFFGLSVPLPKLLEFPVLCFRVIVAALLY